MLRFVSLAIICCFILPFCLRYIYLLLEKSEDDDDSWLPEKATIADEIDDINEGMFINLNQTYGRVLLYNLCLLDTKIRPGQPISRKCTDQGSYDLLAWYILVNMNINNNRRNISNSLNCGMCRREFLFLEGCGSAWGKTLAVKYTTFLRFLSFSVAFCDFLCAFD